MEKNLNKDLVFLNEKIKEIGSALFFPANENMFRFPVSVINLARTDEAGNLWFYIYQPWVSDEAMENDFPVSLDLFKKGKNFSIKVQGMATIHPHHEHLETVPQWMSSIQSNNYLLVHVKMNAAEYFDFNEVTSQSIFEKIKISWYNWLYSLKPHYKLFQFNTNNPTKEDFNFI
ncbi:MAG: hypothetical protein ABI653_03875 [Bacteroidota bacterium]